MNDSRFSIGRSFCRSSGPCWAIIWGGFGGGGSAYVFEFGLETGLGFVATAGARDSCGTA